MDYYYRKVRSAATELYQYYVGGASVAADALCVAIERGYVDLRSLREGCSSVSHRVGGVVRDSVRALEEIRDSELTESPTPLYRQILLTNASLLAGHSAWTLVALKYGIYVDADAGRLVSCSVLNCTVGCSNRFCLGHKMMLICPRYLAMTSISSNSGLMGLHIRAMWEEIRASFDRLRVEVRLAASVWVPWMVLSRIDSSAVLDAFVMSSALDKGIYKRYYLWLRQLNELDDYSTELFSHVYEGKEILDKAEVHAFSTASLIIQSEGSERGGIAKSLLRRQRELGALGGGAMIPGQLRVIKSSGASVFLATQRGFAILYDRGVVANTCIFNCANYLWRMIGGAHKTSCTTTLVPINNYTILVESTSSLHESIASFVASVGGAYVPTEYYARFIVMSYLFGIPSTSDLLITDDDIVPIRYHERELYSSNRLRLSDICHALGGRYSDDYTELKKVCIELLVAARRFYSDVVCMLMPIGLSREVRSKLLQRWCPGERDETVAVNAFIQCLGKSIKNKLGVWSLVGY